MLDVTVATISRISQAKAKASETEAQAQSKQKDKIEGLIDAAFPCPCCR